MKSYPEPILYLYSCLTPSRTVIKTAVETITMQMLVSECVPGTTVPFLIFTLLKK